ncbi:MAG TPA: FdhF/YdeP family oxidoreductase [Vicinamibacterales bacterium]|jgi:molybdopterin-dependent oxidoreductase alpha subunit|nr:FdhF/YdeP family oxidoreductase [Vicinamibacterales bacterium]
MRPFGLGRQKPHHYREMAKILWENRDELPFAWRILTRGTCDGCALGTSGIRDWTITGTHLCMVRLELMRLNTAPALDPAGLTDVSTLTARSSAELRALGRLPEPMIREHGQRGFRVITWDEALDRIARGHAETTPDRMAFYLTSRGITNEVYYAAQKAARVFGTNHVDNSARLCHAASTTAMTRQLGYGASTCSYRDWIGADLIVLFGSNLANNQPVTTKYLYEAKRRGARVVVVNPYREPGLERYWIPSIISSAVAGTALADEWVHVNTGGDLAFLIGVFRALIEANGVDTAFVEAHTSGFDDARAAALSTDWAAIEADAGVSRADIEAFARQLIAKPNTVFVWSMGLTQHAHGVETIDAIINIGLARGLLGRPHRGLVPIRGHSGVQGGAEVGCVPSVKPDAAARWSALWGVPVSTTTGWATMEMIDHAAAGDVDLFWIVGGNFLETVPDEARSRAALRRPRLRIHQDIVLSSSMLVESDGDVLVLPAVTRYESPGGGTETSTERRIIYSPEIPGRRIGSAKPEWWVFREAMRRVRPDLGEDRIGLSDAAAIRHEIAQAIPRYAGIETLQAQGDQVQWGGPVLFAGGKFATPDGRGHFAAATLVRQQPDHRRFFVSTRRGKQFNSMVQRPIDPLTGAAREDILVSASDLAALGASDGAPARLRSAAGEFAGRLREAPIKPGNLEVHWPEGNVLLAGDAIDPQSGEPAYGASVTIELIP